VRDKLCADWLSDYRLAGEFDGILAALKELLSQEDYAIPSSASTSEEGGELEEELEPGRARPPPAPPPTFMLAFAVRRHAPPTFRHREVPVT